MKQHGRSTRETEETEAQDPFHGVNLLLGPIKIHRSVREVFARRTVSHRSDDFVHDFEDIRQRLCKLVNASHVVVLLGPGTLANDAVAAQLSLSRARGLILRNGEFGERLVEQARRFGLSFVVVNTEWADPLPYAEREVGLQLLRGEGAQGEARADPAPQREELRRAEPLGQPLVAAEQREEETL